MKKLLNILGAVSLTATGASSVVACKKPEETKTTKERKPEDKKPEKETKPSIPVVKTKQKATDQQFADEIAKLINKKKYIFVLDDDSKKHDEIIKTLKSFIKEIKIDKFDTSEFDKAKITFENIDMFYRSSKTEIRDIIIKYNNIESNTKINLEFK